MTILSRTTSDDAVGGQRLAADYTSWRKSTQHKSRVSGLLVFGVCAAIALHLVLFALTLRRALSADPHAWASANVMTIARSYARQGIVPLRGLQIANNPPLGKQPDIYTHWPPLFPILLSRVFIVFGESEAIARAFAFVVYGALVFSLYLVVSDCCGRQPAAAAVLAFLTVPASYTFSRLVLGLNLAIACMLIAVWAVIRATRSSAVRWRWIWLGIVAIVLGVAASWEALLLPIVLISVAMVQRRNELARIGALYLVAAVGTFVLVLGLFLVAAPQMAAELWAVLRYRAGYGQYFVSRITLHDIPYQIVYAYHSRQTFSQLAWRNASISFAVFGDLGLLATAGTFVAIRKLLRGTARQNFLMLVVVFGGTWAFWVLLMPNQVSDNAYEMLIAVPAVAVCMAVAFLFVCYELLTNRVCRIGLVAAMLLPLGIYTWRTAQAKQSPTEFAFEHDVEAHTPTDSVVLTPNPDMCAVYYLHRHVIRAIHTDTIVKFALQRLDDTFPGVPIYLAVPGAMSSRFRQSLSAFQTVERTDRLVLLSIGIAGNGRMTAAAEKISGAGELVVPEW